MGCHPSKLGKSGSSISTDVTNPGPANACERSGDHGVTLVKRARRRSVVYEKTKEKPLIGLDCYVPHIVQQRFMRDQDGIDESEANHETMDAVVMLADVSGFTKLTSWLASRGKDGAEQMSNCLNKYFSQMIALINSFGGDIVKFAGDALFVLWWHERYGAVHKQLSLALRCGLMLLKELDNFEINPQVQFRIHIAVNTGKATGMHVGGVGGRYEYILTGSFLHELGPLIDFAKAGEIAVSRAGWELLQTESANNGISSMFEVDSNRVVPEDDERGGSVSAAPVGYIITGTSYDGFPSVLPMSSMSMGAHCTENLRSYVPKAVLEWYDAGGSGWLAENRRITVVFCSVPILPAKEWLVAQKLTMAAQSLLQKYEGTLRQILCDDKGTVIIAGFGVPPYAHGRANIIDATRALMYAMDLEPVITQILQKNSSVFGGSFRASVGVATGENVYCGNVGSQVRCEYCMLGDAVNLSARLMALAGKRDVGVLCDMTTRNFAGDSVEFREEAPAKVKGKDYMIEVFRPLKVAQNVSRKQQAFAARWHEMVGRVEEIKLFRTILNEYKESGDPSVCTVVGAYGVGKSRLLDAFCEVALKEGLSVRFLSGSPLGKDSAWHVARELLRQLFTPQPSQSGMAQLVNRLRASRLLRSSPSARFKRIIRHPQFEAMVATRRLKESLIKSLSPSARFLLPVLKELLPFSVEDNAYTEGMTGKIKGQLIRTLVVELFRASQELEGKRSMLVVDDAIFLDHHSAQLLAHLCDCSRPPMMVTSFRPPKTHEEISTFQKLSFFHNPEEYESVTLVELKPLDAEETKALVLATFREHGVLTVPPEVCDVIIEKSGGYPYFARELTLYVKDDPKTLAIQAGGGCTLLGDPTKIQLPSTMEAIIRDRFDGCSHQQRMVLKVAAVIGMNFTMSVLKEVYPHQGPGEEESRDRLNLEGIVDELCALQFLVIASDGVDTEQRYRFVQTATHNVVYDMILQEQRVNLHRSIANFLEFRHLGRIRASTTMELSDRDISVRIEQYSTCAHHWGRANCFHKEARYLHRAAVASLSMFAYEEATRFAERGIRALDDEARLLCERGHDNTAASSTLRLGVRGVPTHDMELAEVNLLKGKLHQVCGEANFAINDFMKAQHHLEASLDTCTLSWVDVDMYEGDWHCLAISREVGLQLLHVLWPQNFFGIRMQDLELGRARALYESSTRCSRALDRLAKIYFVNGDEDLALGAIYRNVNLMEQVGIQGQELARAYANMAHAEASLHYAKKAQKASDATDSGLLHTQSHVVYVQACIFCGDGKMKHAQRCLNACDSICKVIDDKLQRGLSLNMRAWTHFIASEYRTALHHWRLLFEHGLFSKEVVFIEWGLLGCVRCLLRLGKDFATATVILADLDRQQHRPEMRLYASNLELCALRLALHRLSSHVHMSPVVVELLTTCTRNLLSSPLRIVDYFTVTTLVEALVDFAMLPVEERRVHAGIIAESSTPSPPSNLSDPGPQRVAESGSVPAKPAPGPEASGSGQKKSSKSDARHSGSGGLFAFSRRLFRTTSDITQGDRDLNQPQPAPSSHLSTAVSASPPHRSGGSELTRVTSMLQFPVHLGADHSSAAAAVNKSPSSPDSDVEDEGPSRRWNFGGLSRPTSRLSISHSIAHSAASTRRSSVQGGSSYAGSEVPSGLSTPVQTLTDPANLHEALTSALAEVSDHAAPATAAASASASAVPLPLSLPLDEKKPRASRGHGKKKLPTSSSSFIMRGRSSKVLLGRQVTAARWHPAGDPGGPEGNDIGEVHSMTDDLRASYEKYSASSMQGSGRRNSLTSVSGTVLANSGAEEDAEALTKIDLVTNAISFAKDACTVLCQLGERHPAVLPYAFLLQGRLLAFEGRGDEAVVMWRTGLCVASQRAGPYEESLLRRQLAVWKLRQHSIEEHARQSKANLGPATAVVVDATSTSVSAPADGETSRRSSRRGSVFSKPQASQLQTEAFAMLKEVCVATTALGATPATAEAQQILKTHSAGVSIPSAPTDSPGHTRSGRRMSITDALIEVKDNITVSLAGDKLVDSVSKTATKWRRRFSLTGDTSVGHAPLDAAPKGSASPNSPRDGTSANAAAAAAATAAAAASGGDARIRSRGGRGRRFSLEPLLGKLESLKPGSARSAEDKASSPVRQVQALSPGVGVGVGVDLPPDLASGSAPSGVSSPPRPPSTPPLLPRRFSEESLGSLDPEVHSDLKADKHPTKHATKARMQKGEMSFLVGSSVRVANAKKKKKKGAYRFWPKGRKEGLALFEVLKPHRPSLRRQSTSSSLSDDEADRTARRMKGASDSCVCAGDCAPLLRTTLDDILKQRCLFVAAQMVSVLKETLRGSSGAEPPRRLLTPPTWFTRGFRKALRLLPYASGGLFEQRSMDSRELHSTMRRCWSDLIAGSADALANHVCAAINGPVHDGPSVKAAVTCIVIACACAPLLRYHPNPTYDQLHEIDPASHSPLPLPQDTTPAHLVPSTAGPGPESLSPTLDDGPLRG
eukprot:Rmarinus@m.26155